MEDLELRPGGTEPLPIGRDPYALGGDGLGLTVRPLEALRAVDRGRTGDEPGRVDHVRRAPRVQHAHGVGQRPHEAARPAGMIEVHVGEQDVVDCLRTQLERAQRREQIGHRVIGTHIDERGPPALLDEVRGGVSRVQVLGVDGGDDVGMARQPGRWQGRNLIGHAVMVAGCASIAI